ncbi:hypothetical protein SAMN02745221_00780 [Thermosyntropha lipolytica DSM 11003]|uniref:Uncharacterized protein n=1 Tax=Thermosyntropha lipolytica DSM 11003 TaxID=1123382 RepID=A0A1M5LYE2_9FIRM|nr:mechanosensitive ion channel family protein [Thermosyntropha lipolytica]SHG69659.1 hypothetical protein SAMN02745221_00780 [Thermosyntropha lipolytica DSM 11003]
MSTGLKRIGYSYRINDPAFEEYVRKTNRWSLIFALILAFIAVIGFYIAGETSSEMSNPEALLIGLGIGGMFIAIALIQISWRQKAKTWDGEVIDKKIEHKKRIRDEYDSENNRRTYVEHYTLYTVLIRREDGKIHPISVEDNDTIYNYYQVGDKVRYHGFLNSFEKYDKSKDTIIFCNACGTLCDINEDYCYRCKCPLLK